MLSGVPLRAATMSVKLQRPKMALGDSWPGQEGFSRAEGKIVDGVGIEDVTSVEISRCALARLAARVLRIVGVSASWRVLVDLVGQGVVGRDQQAVRESCAEDWRQNRHRNCCWSFRANGPGQMQDRDAGRSLDR